MTKKQKHTKETRDEEIKNLCITFIERSAKPFFSDNQDFLTLHHKLLLEDVDKFLEPFSENPHSSPIAYKFATMHILLQRCKEVGLEQAFSEAKLKELHRAFIGNGIFLDKEDFVRENPELLTPESDQVLSMSASRQKSEKVHEMFESIRLLFKRCKQIGITQAFVEFKKDAPQQSSSERELSEALLDFITANTLDELKKVIKRYPELLKQEIDLLQMVGDPRMLPAMKEKNELLKKLREIGAKKIFALLENNDKNDSSYENSDDGYGGESGEGNRGNSCNGG